MVNRKRWLPIALLLALVLAAPAVQTQGRITTTKEMFGVSAGDDYVLLNYTQLVDYWKKLASESPRMKLVDIGKTAEGRTMIMAIITSPENHKNLARYKEISQKLGRAEGLTDDEARKLVHEGKAVVWIDGGLHATECINAQGLFEMAYQMTSRSDAETMRILNDVILLLTPVNPDGMELVSNWYMREKEPKRRTTGGLPVLYQKYVGHDNNRDSYMNNQPETEATSRQLYTEWIPQIMYNQHQTGPAGTILFAPPFRDPFNYNYDPLVPIGIDLVSAAIHTRFLEEGKAGATMRTGANYSTWFNGGSRTTTGFHNQIGILTEIIGNPTPMQVAFVPDRQLPKGDMPMPIAPQPWTQRQSIDYIMTVNRAILDIASDMREDFLFRIYRMGKNSIERGSRDSWTVTPKVVNAVKELIAKEQPAGGGGGRGAGAGGGGGAGGGAAPATYYEKMRDPAKRDPRGYILPSDQPDFLTATKFVNVLVKGGVVVHRATQPFTVAGKSYPAGSYVIKAAQAFRPHLRDMLEPQDHPDDIPYPGATPRRPYDVTGYTLAYQMGVKFDRILDGFDGPFEKLAGLAPIPAGTVTGTRAAGYLVGHQLNDAYTVTNRLLAAKEEVYWLKQPVKANGRTYPAGTLYIPAKPTTKALVDKLAAETGVGFDALATKAGGEALKLKPMRVALYDQYGGSMPSGWIRWMLEHPFPTSFEVVYPPALDAGNLIAKYDVIIFPSGAIPAAASEGEGGFGGRGGGGGQGGQPQANVPAEYAGRQGRITPATTIPALRKFVEDGGTIIAIGSSTNIASHFGLPVTNHLIERMPDGTERRLGPEKYYVPGSVVEATVDTTQPIAWGFEERVDFFFDNSPVFDLMPDAVAKGTLPVVWFPDATPLRSGWGWGQGQLKGGVAAVDAKLGKGRVFLFGPEITFRAQPHGTFKFLFNGIYLGGATPVSLGPSPRT
jgi:hypothetical protein